LPTSESTLVASDRGLPSAFTVVLNLAFTFIALSTYSLLVASDWRTGYATFVSTLFANDRDAVSEVTLALNLDAVSTYIFVAAS
jgi:hypothetical protein